jgi:hypothetical protein
MFGQAVSGLITGTVTDPSGAVLPGATIQVRNVETGVTRTVVSNEQGRYTVPDLIVGTYEIQATMSGFQTLVIQGIPLSVGAQRVQDLALEIGQAQQTITVEGRVAQVDVTTAAIGTTIEPTQIRELPLNGRNFTQLLILAPGVTQTNNPGEGNSRFGRQARFAISGARPEGQAYLLDNTNIMNFWNHGPGSGVLGTTLGVEAIAEFQTLTNAYSAQFGGNGVVVNAASKSGGNAFHGSLYEYLRNSALDARNPFDGPKLPPFRQNQYGGSLGGPVRKDRAFFFYNYEAVRRTQGQTRIVNTPDANARQGILPGQAPIQVHPVIQQLLKLYPVPPNTTATGVGQVTQVAFNRGEQHYHLGRFDYNFSEKDSFFFRYVEDRGEVYDPFNGSNIPLWPAFDTSRNRYATIEERHVYSPTVVSLTRFSYVRTGEFAAPSPDTLKAPELQFFPGRTGGQVIVAGLSTIGTSFLIPFTAIQNKFTLAHDVYWTSGTHNVRFGGAYDRFQTNLNAPAWWGGQYTFPSLAAFLRNQPSLLVGGMPGQDHAYRDFRERGFPLYIQDDWKVRPRLTLNLGLRYHYITNPVPVRHPLITAVNPPFSNAYEQVPRVFASNPNNRNFDPRFGFAWDPFKSHKTAIRGGFGIFHNVIQSRTYGSMYYQNPPYVLGQQVNPVFPTPFVGGGAPPLPSMQNGVDYQTRQVPYQMQWNFNIQQELPLNMILTVGYVGSRGVHLFKQRDINPPVPVIRADGTPVFGTPDPTGRAAIIPNARINRNFGALISAAADANSNFNSLQTSLNRRFANNFQAQFQHTWSKCIDEGSGTFGLEGGTPNMNPYHRHIDRGNCVFDRRHNMTLSGVYVLPFNTSSVAWNKLLQGWQLSGIWRVVSGAPFHPTIADQAGLPNIGQRPSLAPGRTVKDATLGGIARYLDPTAFVMPAAGTLGNLGRNVFRGPGFWNVDFSVNKNTTIPSISEQFAVQFRAEFFNIFNHPSFGLPNTQVFNLAPNGGSTLNPVFGQIQTTQSTARQIQFALRVSF